MGATKHESALASPGHDDGLLEMTPHELMPLIYAR
jgi:hypothetical protein